MDLPAAHSAVRMARAVVGPFAETRGIVGDELDTLLLVVSELLANAVDHGGGGAALEEEDLERPVRMSFDLEIGPESWELAVEDEGGGDPEVVRALIEPDGLPDLEDERGRGFFLLASMVDSLTVDVRADGLGLVIRAVKVHAGS
jgi:anti-sigma regulatory factor (Ser/Thr protein kinase)